MNQSAFARAILNPNTPLPQGLVDPQGHPAPRRFDVYRNNVILSLIRVLEAGFPATRALVGEEFFAAMAAEFVRAHPPRIRIMMLYGAEFAEFINGFPPASGLGYLPDVARLEQAIRESYHAADSTPMDATLFATMSDAALMGLRLTFAPAMKILRSEWPIFGIWSANIYGTAPPQMQGEAVIVLRPAFDPAPAILPTHSFEVLNAMQQGAEMGDALAAATGPFDLTELLKLLLAGGAIIGGHSDAD